MHINSIRAALRRQPFEPFSLRLVDGREVRVPHPDFVAISKRQVFVVHPDETFSVLDPVLILSLEGKNGGFPSEDQPPQPADSPGE